MRRRDILALAASMAALRLPAAHAQQPPKRYRIALVAGQLPPDWREYSFWRAILNELRTAGYVEGQNVEIAAYSTEGRFERYDLLANDVVAGQPDVIIAGGNFVLYPLKSATRTIPIVASMGDPLATGLVSSLAHPGDNFTGVSVDAGIEIYGKRLQILKAAVPSATRIAHLATRAWQEGPQRAQIAPLRAYASQLGVSLIEAYAADGSPNDVEAGFNAVAAQQPDGLLVSPEAELGAAARLIGELAEKHRLPAIYPTRNYIERGSGLMAYAPDPVELARQLADRVKRVLGGTKAGDIPIYQATRFELTINIRAARAIGLTIPPSLLARADEVLE